MKERVANSLSRRVFVFIKSSGETAEAFFDSLRIATDPDADVLRHLEETARDDRHFIPLVQEPAKRLDTAVAQPRKNDRAEFGPNGIEMIAVRIYELF